MWVLVFVCLLQVVLKYIMLTRRSSRARVKNVRLTSLSPQRVIKRKRPIKVARNVSPPRVVTPSRIPTRVPRMISSPPVVATPSRIPRPSNHPIYFVGGEQEQTASGSDNESEVLQGGVQGPPKPTVNESEVLQYDAQGPSVFQDQVKRGGVQGPPKPQVAAVRDSWGYNCPDGVEGSSIPRASAFMREQSGEQGPPVCSYSYPEPNGGYEASLRRGITDIEAPKMGNTSDALQQAVNDILGNAKSGQFAQELSNTAGVGLPLGATLPRKLKSKIVAGEFVELAQIVFPNGADEVELHMIFNQDGSRALNLEPPKSKSLTSIEAWTSAMLIYGAVYLPMHMGEVADFFYYIYFVRRMASRGGNWRTYDNVFRRAKASAKFSWRFLLQEAYLEAMTQSRSSFRPQRGNRTPNFTVQGTRVPVGFCAQFHRGQCTFPKCRFKHSCFQCGGNHKFTACRKPVRSIPQVNKQAFGVN